MTEENQLEKILARSRKLREGSAALRAQFETDSARMEDEAVQEKASLDATLKALGTAYTEDLAEDMRQVDQGIEAVKKEQQQDDERWKNAGMPPEPAEQPEDNPDTPNAG